MDAPQILFSLSLLGAIAGCTLPQPGQPPLATPAPAGEIAEISVPAAQAGPTIHRQRLQFAPNTRSAVRENSVIRGERDLYLINARANQYLQLRLTALEDNAVFEVLAPNGQLLQEEETSANLRLPASGDYQVIVGGTRGNATYRLEVAIDDRPFSNAP
ncbi:MAG: hypothetical protein HC890_06190 [Chloroflexaceae bacterium]|nr:hypothetical protein [Chloroflexaceae bacterium]